MKASRKRKKGNPAKDGPALQPASSPLEALVFLLPLICFYEIGCLALHAGASATDGRERVVAFHLLQLFFQLFGSSGIWMPGLAVIVILLCTQFVAGKPWSVRRRVVGLLYLESIVLSVPLLVFNLVLRAEIPSMGGPPDPLLADVVLGLGAGIYEELVFRLVLISLLVMLGTDVLRLPARTTMIASIALAALVFSAHHHPPLGSEPYSTARFLFRAAAGVYLGILFVFRGYAHAAGAHAAYNIILALL